MQKSVLLTLLILLIPCRVLADEQLWELWKSEADIEVFQRKQVNGLVEVKAKMRINTRISAFIALLNDTENISLWLDRVESSSVLKQIAINENIVYSSFAAPWPAKDRDMITYSHYWQESNGTFVLEISDLSSYLPQKDNYLRITNVSASWTLIPLKNSEVMITYQAFADPGGKLPLWLINHLALSSIYNTFAGLRYRIMLPQYQSAHYPNIKEL